MSDANLLDRAMEHHRAERLDEAVQLYDRILKAQPDHVDALHLLGTIAYQRGDDARTIGDCIEATRMKGARARGLCPFRRTPHNSVEFLSFEAGPTFALAR